MKESELQGNRLEQVRKSLNISQVKFGKRLGISQGYLNQVLKGRRNISYKILNAVTKNYPDVDMEWVLTGDGTMFKSDLKTPAVSDNQLNVIPESDLILISANIACIRHHWNLDQDEFGELIGGITRNQVSNWERARTEPDYDSLSRLEALTGISQKRIRTTELSREEIPGIPRSVGLSSSVNPSLREIHKLQKEILRRVGLLEEMIRALQESGIDMD